MNREAWRQRALSIGWLAVCLIPVPFGAFASDRVFFVTLSFLIFALGSFLLPLWLRHRQIKKQGTSAYATTAMQLYASLTGLLFSLSFLDLLNSSVLWQNYYSRVAAYFLWMLTTLILQSLLARGFDWWKDNRRKHAYSEFLDPCLYALPIPCVFFGTTFFHSMNEFDQLSLFGPGIFVLMGLCYFLTLIFVIGTLVLYFYPRKNRYSSSAERAWQLVRLLIMLLVWVGLHVPSSPYISFSVGITPIFQGSYLVYLIPLVAEALALCVAVACSNLVFLVPSNKKYL